MLEELLITAAREGSFITFMPDRASGGYRCEVSRTKETSPADLVEVKHADPLQAIIGALSEKYELDDLIG